MSLLGAFFAALAPYEALIFLIAALIVGALALSRRRRPLSMSRTMDVALSTILFVILGVRYAILCAVTLLFPTVMLVGAGPALKPVIAALYAIAAVIGFATHRGSIPARALGAATLTVVTLVDLVLFTFVLQETAMRTADMALALLLAIAASISAALFWTYRTAAPNPLGGDKRPLDY